jgi:hypothetical protein
LASHTTAGVVVQAAHFDFSTSSNLAHCHFAPNEQRLGFGAAASPTATSIKLWSCRSAVAFAAAPVNPCIVGVVSVKMRAGIDGGFPGVVAGVPSSHFANSPC